ITWPESVDQALCFGWIDGVRQGIDDGTYAIRFSPRKPGSIWSAANQKRIQELSKEGLVQAAGLAAFKARRPGKSGVYSYEQGTGFVCSEFSTQMSPRTEWVAIVISILSDDWTKSKRGQRSSEFFVTVSTPRLSARKHR